jgi:hypothetical protein
MAWLDAAERAFAAAADEPYEPSVGRAASLLVNVPTVIAQDRAFLAVVRGNTDRAVALASQALADLGEGEWMLARSSAGIWPWPNGCAAGSQRPKRPWRRLSPSGERPASASWPCDSSSCLALSSVARATWRRPLRPTARRWRWPPRPAGRPCPPPASPMWAWPRSPTSGASLPPPAARWTTQRGLHPDDQPSYQREPEHLVLARVLLAEQAPQQALGLLGRLHELAVAQARVGSVIEIQALLALALADSGDQRGALAEALRLAAPEGYVRVFVDEGPPMASLLGRLAGPGQREQLAENVPPATWPGCWRASRRPLPRTRRVGRCQAWSSR